MITKTKRAKKRKKALKLSVYYINIRGFQSKSISLENIILSLNSPEVIVLCEIKSVSAPVIRRFFKSMGYDIILKKSSGLVIAAKFKFDMVNITTTANDNILTGSLKVGGMYISVVAVYGLQESDSADSRIAFFDDLGTELQANDNREHVPILVGDFNSKSKLEDSQVVHDSPNGALLLQFINQFSLVVLNFNEISTGKWTRVEKKKDVIEKSVLDYVLTREVLSQNLSLFNVDEEKLIAPFWSRNKQMSRQHSDHNAIYLSFTLPQPKSVATTEPKHNSSSAFLGWRMSPDGLITFKEMTSSLPSIQGKPAEIMSTVFTEQLADVMDKCFVQRKMRCRNHPNLHQDNIIHHYSLEKVMQILVKYIRLGRREKAVARQYIDYVQLLQNELYQKRKADKVSDVLQNLSDEHGELAINKFWKLKRSLSSQDNTKASIVTRDNVEIFSPPAIISEYRSEFINRLSHRTINPNFMQYQVVSNKLFQAMLSSSEKCHTEPPFTCDEVGEVLLTLKSGSSCGPDKFPPDVFREAGPALVQNITVLLNTIKFTRSVPVEWLDLIIVTIFKNKGSRKLLEYYRGIFLSNICKIIEKLIKRRVKHNLKWVNIRQTGSRTNRGPPDSLFLVNGMIDHAKYLHKQLFLTFYDYSTCFDSLWLEDSMISLWDLGITNEMFSLIFKMNENSMIRVKTPFGMSAPFSSPRIVKQGSVLSSNLCSSSTAELCDSNVTGGSMVGSLFISNLLYVDDTTDVNEDTVEVVESHYETMNFSDSKRLNMNAPKCGLLTINKKPHYTTPTLIVGKGTISQVSRAKLLGDIINDKGTNVDMIDDKVKNAKAAMVNSLALCSELTMGVHLMRATLVMYGSVFLATLLFNCQAWTNLTKTDIKRLETAQIQYLKKAAHAPLSVTNSFTFLEFGVLPASYLIHYRQLTFLYHILKLDNTDPVKVMYHEQKTLPFEKNWANHMEYILQLYGLDCNDIFVLSKSTWKGKAKKAVRDKAFSCLIIDSSNKSKTKKVTYSSYSRQSYLFGYKFEDACTIFKLRSRSVNCKGNQKSSSKSIICRLCKTCDETQQHIINCPAASDGPILDLSVIYEENIQPNNEVILQICSRVQSFLRKVNDIAVEESGKK